MRIPLSLLKSYLPLTESLDEIEKALTLLGIEVDGILGKTPSFSGVVSAEIVKAAKHPNADRLFFLEVFDGTTSYPVVCGGANCRVGLKVAYAKVGASLTDENEKIRVLKVAKIRDVESHGMLAARSELHIPGEDKGEILELPGEMPVGKDLSEILHDPVFEISLTPNLGHCQSALGIARELSAALQLPLKMHTHQPIAELGPIEKKIHVEVEDASLCPRYTCRLIEGVEIASSPFWLQKTLLDAGFKPINNVVDITNYILLKTGQPLHAFDFEKIEGKKIFVKKGNPGTPFLGLDGVERNIPEDTIVISDAKKVLALGGVLGGDLAVVAPGTSKILLEAAFFNPKRIRSTSKKLSLRTESAVRFEKGIDPNYTLEALEEATDWILKLAGGKLYANWIDVKKETFSSKPISLRVQRVERVLGIKISLGEIESLLKRLSFSLRRKNSEEITVDVPYFRFDLSQEIDLIEEIARIYGYNHIEKKRALYSASSLADDPLFLFHEKLKEKLTAFSLQEIITSDLIGPKLASFLPSREFLLKALHAKTEEYSILRSSLLPSFLEVAKRNFDRKNHSLRAFEIANVHFQEKEKPLSISVVSLLLCGDKEPRHWSEKEKGVDFYDLKGLLENLFQSLSLPSLQWEESANESFHPKRQASLISGREKVGMMGEVHPNILSAFDLKERILFAEIEIPPLLLLQKKKIRMKPLSLYPSSERDATLTLSKDQKMGPLFEVLKKSGVSLLESFELIDLYFPPQEEKKHATFRFTYRDITKTLSFEEVESAHKNLLEKLTKAI